MTRIERADDGGGRATILHADLDSFYASVAQRDSPRLRGRPVAVGGGVILAASYEAKRLGVRTAMSGRQARRLCPQLIEVRPDFEAYTAASRAVFDIFRRTTPLVQGVSIDEAFLDVGGLHRIDPASPTEIGARLRREVWDEVGLPITVGVARTPFLAKVASRVAKPDGLLEVTPDGEDAFLFPLAVDQLWGVGETTATRLRSFGLHTAGDVAELSQAILVGILGPSAGRHLYAVVHGQTGENVVVGRRRSSVGAQRAIGRGPHSPAFVEAALLGLVDRVCGRMRSGDRLAQTVVLRLRFEDYTKATRSRSLRHPTSSTAALGSVATALLREAGPLIAERGITLVGVALSGLEGDSSVQPELSFDDIDPRSHDTRALDAAADALGERFGSAALVRGSLLRSGSGFSMPTLPDPVEEP